MELSDLQQAIETAANRPWACLTTRGYNVASPGGLFLLAAGRSLKNRSRAGRCAGSSYPFLTQKERDVETGLDYFGARYFASVQGRFTTVDPFGGSGRPRSPQTWNRYAYVLNNPVKLVDPDGMEGQDAQQVVDIGKDKIINKKVEEIRKTAKPLKPGVEPVATSVVYIPGEQTQLKNATLVDPDGDILGRGANGYMRSVAVAVLDQGGNIINAPNDMFIKEKITADSPDAKSEEQAKRLITSETDEKAQAKNGLFYDFQVRATGPLSKSLDVRTTQDLTIRQ